MRRGQVAQATPAGGEKGSADREPRTAQAGPRRCSCSGQTRGGASASTLRARPARQLPPRPHGGPSERRALLAEAGTLLPLARRRERRGKGRAVHRRKGARRRRVHEGRHAGGRRQEPRRPRASAPPADRHEHDGLPEISDIEKLMFLNERNNDLPPPARLLRLGHEWRTTGGSVPAGPVHTRRQQADPATPRPFCPASPGACGGGAPPPPRPRCSRSSAPRPPLPSARARAPCARRRPGRASWRRASALSPRASAPAPRAGRQVSGGCASAEAARQPRRGPWPSPRACASSTPASTCRTQCSRAFTTTSR